MVSLNLLDNPTAFITKNIGMMSKNKIKKNSDSINTINNPIIMIAKMTAMVMFLEY